jgi:hypothetical protein
LVAALLVWLPHAFAGAARVGLLATSLVAAVFASEKVMGEYDASGACLPVSLPLFVLPRSLVGKGGGTCPEVTPARCGWAGARAGPRGRTNTQKKNRMQRQKHTNAKVVRE